MRLEFLKLRGPPSGTFALGRGAFPDHPCGDDPGISLRTSDARHWTDYSTRIPEDDTVVRHIRLNHRIGGGSNPTPYSHLAYHLRPRADPDIVANFRDLVVLLDAYSNDCKAASDLRLWEDAASSPVVDDKAGTDFRLDRNEDSDAPAHEVLDEEVNDPKDISHRWKSNLIAPVPHTVNEDSLRPRAHEFPEKGRNSQLMLIP
jgi:hypothetical protein